MVLAHRLSGQESPGAPLGLVFVGADLEPASKRTFPALFRLVNYGITKHIVKCVAIVDEQFEKDEEMFKSHIKKQLGPGQQNEFLEEVSVVRGNFNNLETANTVKNILSDVSRIIIYYIPTLILTPDMTSNLTQALKEQCNTKEGGFLRCIVEKPLGKNLASARELAHKLNDCFDGEANVFRLDHFLGKAMVQNILTLRFANRFLEPSWNNNHINSVIISCRENKLATGKFYKYFDKYGIVREIMMDHLLHMMALVAIEPPVTLQDVHDEITKLVRCIRPIDMNDVVLGQYEGYGKGEEGYNPEKPSRTPTFAMCVLYVDNPRWYGVPFILKAGKGMYERRTDIRIQFKLPHNTLFKHRDYLTQVPNELVIRVQPARDIYMKMMRRVPGSRKFNINVTKLDFLGYDPSIVMNSTDPFGHPGTRDIPHGSYTSDKYTSNKGTELVGSNFSSKNAYEPDSYERLISDVIENDRTHFSPFNEFIQMFSIFNPLLEEIEKNKLNLFRYAVGDKGPNEAYMVSQKVGYFEYKLDSELVGKRNIPQFHRIVREFSLTPYQMEEIVGNFLKEFKKGLRGDPDTSIAMLPSYVTSIPKGTETGVYYALDLGGTNFRVTRFKLNGKGLIKNTDESKFTVPDAMMLGTCEELFDFLAKCVASLNKPKDEGKRVYGFTFSFPVNQTSLGNGTLIKWNKSFKTTGVVGKDVVDLLHKALEKIGFNGHINSIANDTVGTLVSSAYSDPRSMVGVILGTGTNAAYREQVKNIPKLSNDVRAKGGEMIINTEWGNFGSKVLGQLPLSPVDINLDADSRNPGMQKFEKMISGLYLGEITRLILVKLYEAGEIWSSSNTVVPDSLKEKPHSFPTRILSDIEYDMSEDLHVVQNTETLYGILNSSLNDRVKLKEICGMVIARAAKLTACAIAAALRQIGPEKANGCTVGVDGSVYELHPSFRLRLRQALGELGCQCRVVLAKDGSGQGSALVACGADHE